MMKILSNLYKVLDMYNISDFIIRIRNNYTYHRIIMGLILKEFIFSKYITLEFD
jgi:hypothetical protein